MPLASPKNRVKDEYAPAPSQVRRPSPSTCGALRRDRPSGPLAVGGCITGSASDPQALATWSVVGGIGTIDSAGMFNANTVGAGAIVGTVSIFKQRISIDITSAIRT